ncbi:MAG TPA: 30S ribosomal protein S8 [Candidatus Polarisedimenticolia bacterium]|nr:30S ribosomal protein S8 [Candidatus Polarisedimenticolia bacterium]
MTMTDPIADLATRIRNALGNDRREVTVPHSRLKAAICDALQREGFLEGWSVEAGHVQGMLRLRLKYGPDGERVIRRIQRVSTPGRRLYCGVKDLRPVLRGMGIRVLTTNRGVLSDREARDQRVGGEPLLEVW